MILYKNIFQFIYIKAYMSQIEKKLILFYMQWCPHSERLRRVVWKYFMNNYENHQSIVIKEIDCNGDDEHLEKILTEYRIRQPFNAYPAIILFIKDQAFLYHGTRSINAIEQFLESPTSSHDADALTYLPEKGQFTIHPVNRRNNIDELRHFVGERVRYINRED
jgi:hypothetical protein